MKLKLGGDPIAAPGVDDLSGHHVDLGHLGLDLLHDLRSISDHVFVDGSLSLFTLELWVGDQYLSHLALGELATQLDEVDLIVLVLRQYLDSADEVVSESDLGDPIQFGCSCYGKSF